jgi:hypothetical protein
MLRLYSKDAELLAERQVGSEDVSVLPLPGRQAFVLAPYWKSHEIDVLKAQDLSSSKTCAYPNFRSITSVSEHNVLLRLASPSSDPLLRRLDVYEICGSRQFAYEWSGFPLTAALLDDTRIALTNPNVVLMNKDIKKWTDSFKSKHESVEGPVSASENGDIFAVMVTRYVGGSDFLEVDAHLKSTRIVVYSSGNGKHLAEVPVEHLPKYVFDFAVSPDGKLLAILSDGELQRGPIRVQ